MTQPDPRPATGWADLFAEGRLPRFVLICLGVWLNAADALVASTIMPSVGADLGGHAYFGWATAAFLFGAIVAGASAGRLSELLGLRRATLLAGVAFVGGCLLAALAPDMFAFLGGRLLQGVGSGWLSGFAMVAIAMLFPERHLARVFAAVAGVWGVATLLGPLIGGLFAQAGQWRGVFWFFAAQGVLFCLAVPWLLSGTAPARSGARVPLRQLLVLTVGVGFIALANLTRTPLSTVATLAAGMLVLVGMLRLDARAPVRLLPHDAGSPRTAVGAGYLAMFALMAGSMGLTVYAPVLLQMLRGVSPLSAGYVVAAQAMSWTLAAFAVAGVSGATGERRCIRTGGMLVAAGALLLVFTLRDAPLAWVVASAVVMGAGFGLSSSLSNRRVLGLLHDDDRAIGASAFIAMRQTGGAVGAAVAGAAANAIGFGAAPGVATAQSAAVWVTATGVPFACVGAWAAWRLTRPTTRAAQV
ncbi:MFS transporter [Luteimonas sp. RD2P54]|uniref:MFS transporter n=1 Tax=Luteimonas endophytica TaxID=3042023 RepID=A0ABT6J799_9GAMM|nr:MFS transporter [Luteimonas endophytica]MDH5822693.1 MFS transporter [Luteimonas endophytica]